MNICKMCLERGKTWEGSDPKCAFVTGIFSSDNWNCTTMSELRSLCEEVCFSEDHSASVLGYDASFIFISWYKNRGQTQFATLCSGGQMKYLTEEIALEFIKHNSRKNSL